MPSGGRAPTFINPRRRGAWGQALVPAGSLKAREAATDPFPIQFLPHVLHSRYLLFMKLAALQLMQQKASKMENSTSLENGSPPSLESKSEDPLGPEAGSEEEGGNASGLAKVKELAETIASDDGTGGLLWVPGSPGPVLAAGLAQAAPDPVPGEAGIHLFGERGRLVSLTAWVGTAGPRCGWAASQRAMSPQQTHGAGR